jgi:hypothetical protein
MSDKKTPTYRLRFFVDYHCDGCLWPDNDAAYNKFGHGPLDADVFEIGIRIQLPDATRQKVSALDELYCENLDWSDPGDGTQWDKQQWDDFYSKARQLHKEVSDILGDDFEVVYKQE